MTHEYTILSGGTIIRGGDEADASAIAWAADTVLLVGGDDEVRAISRGDSHFFDLDGAFVAPLEGSLETGGPADLVILSADPRAASAPPTRLATIRGGRLVEGNLGRPEQEHTESVWAYPRPPLIEQTQRHLRVVFAGRTVAETQRGLRVLETASPPTYYFPPDDVEADALRPAGYQTVCEWKGRADHFDLIVGERVSARAAWAYGAPRPGYEALAGYVAFYPARVDEATVDGEVVQAQPGGYYGGWITHEIIGPWKGEPGTEGW